MWISDAVNDYDQDGCNDVSEDEDDDNDGIVDTLDTCPIGKLNWISEPMVDSDADGCHDADEDTDYVPVEIEENETVNPNCNPYVQDCSEEKVDKASITEESTEGQVKQLVMTMLALAIIPTAIGLLLLAYRMKW